MLQLVCPRATLWSMALAGGLFALPASAANKPSPPPLAPAAGATQEALREGEAAYQQLDTFARVLAYIENNYVEEVPRSQLLTGAIKGMVATLDPHSVYMPPDVFKAVSGGASGEVGGLGLELATRTVVHNGVRLERITVVAPLDDTPAARAGIRPGDVIVKIDGESTAGMDLETAVARMRGPPGSRIVLTLMREGFAEPRDLVLVRDRVKIVSVEGRLYGPFAYVKVKNFQEHTDRFLARALDDLRKQNGGELRGLVLDLRNNPGGLLEQAVRVSDRFLPGGLSIVSTQGRGGRRVEEEKTHERDTEPLYPMIVLVNGGSASASEIVAGALQDHGRALVMGSQTFGKGSVQTLIQLEDGSGLKLTVARYFTPKGRSIQEKGITPDVVVEDPATEANGFREADLKNHFKNDFKDRGPGRPGVTPSAAEAKGGAATAPDPAEDVVLKTALDYLKSWDLFSSVGRRPAGRKP